MKNPLPPIILLLILLLLPGAAAAQVTNLVINGSSTSFTMTSGGLVDWSYNIPAGEGALGEIWLDVNANHAIDPGTDKLLLAFVQTDGDTIGNNGPPDTDGIVDGEVHLTMPVGFAPADYVLRFEHDAVGLSMWGTVHAIPSPAFSVSGTVHAPPAVDVGYLVVEAERDGNGGVSFWMGITDANGDYTIEMGPDTAGNPWEVFLSNIPPGVTIARNDTFVVIDGHVTGVDFFLAAPAAQVAGQLLTDAGDTLRYTNVYIARVSTGGLNVSHDALTDATGRFWFGIPADELNGDTWQMGEWFGDSPVTGRMMASAALPALTGGDSLVRNLVSFLVNSTIQGFVQIDGSTPGFPVRMSAVNRDSGGSWADADGSTGAFTMNVSAAVHDYELWPVNLFGSYQYPFVTAHPGDGGVIYNLTTTAVEEGAELPEAYSLGQNYPNPFNPLTTIPYALPERSAVRLAVYDLLGREVATLVDEIQEPGVKSVLFDVASLPSGVYAYRIVAKGFTDVGKMVVIR